MASFGGFAGWGFLEQRVCLKKELQQSVDHGAKFIGHNLSFPVGKPHMPRAVSITSFVFPYLSVAARSH